MIAQQQLDKAAACARQYVLDGEMAMNAFAACDDGGVRARAAFGKEGEERPDLCDKQYALASISKAITGVLTAVLCEQGVLSYETPVVEYLPEFGSSAARRSIKLGQVFNHSTGLPTRFVADTAGLDFDPDKLLAELCFCELAENPGTVSRYSSFPYQLINAAIRAQLDLSMEEALQRFVCEPCGLRATSYYPRPETAMEVLDPQIPEGLDYEPVQRLEMSGGGLWSTLDDMLRLGRAWLGEKLVSPETVAKATAIYNPLPVVDRQGILSRRTLGFDRTLGCFPNQPESGYYHGGATGTLWYMDPERDLVYAFLTNRWGASIAPAFQVLGCLYA